MWQCQKCYGANYTVCSQGTRWWLICHRCGTDAPLLTERGYRLIVVPDPLLNRKY